MTATAPVREQPWTSGAIWKLLQERYCVPEWVLIAEVTLGDRRLDGLAMNQWASRGRCLVGFEIKVSRSDWLNELKNFQKAEAAYRECDQFYLVTPKDIVKDGELPVGWGHLQTYGVGLRQIAAPARTTPSHTMHRELAARLLSRFAQEEQREQWRRDVNERADVRTQVIKEVQEKHERQTKELRDERDQLRADHNKLLRALGSRASSSWHSMEDALKAAAIIASAVESAETNDARLRVILSEMQHKAATGLAALDTLKTGTVPPLSDYSSKGGTDG